jgi:hypothetical protein
MAAPAHAGDTARDALCGRWQGQPGDAGWQSEKIDTYSALTLNRFLDFNHFFALYRLLKRI